DRRERFGDLSQLHDAVEGVQPRPPAEGERNIFAALRTRFSRPPPEKEAVAKVIDRLHHLESQAVALGKAQSRLEGALRQVQETVERFEDGQRRLNELQRRRGSSVAPGFLAGAVAALAVVGGAWALGMVSAPAALRPAAPPAPAAAPVPALPTPPPEPPIPAKETAKEGTKEAAQKESATPPGKQPVPDASAAAAEADAAVEDAGALAAAEDAGAEPADAGIAAAEDAGAPTRAATAPPPAAKKSRTAQSNQAAMQHALAVSQVRRGETALEQGQTDEALQSFRAALDSEPTMAVAFRGLGMAYSMQGKDTQALQAYERYLKLAPTAPDAGDIRNSIKELRARAKGAAR
ncbi:MAG TPA: tetratricopeptide repeat protein, partial [Myxococcales bacterium]|nr:tetratricopeptide repeat protein [Myxococcales bacterium]